MPVLLDSPTNLKTIALARAEELRLEANGRLDGARQSEMGQFFTGAKLASWMASWFEAPSETLRLLDAGAGVGSLSAAFVSEICLRSQRPRKLEVVAYEADSLLIPALERTRAACEAECERANVALDFQIVSADFIFDGVTALQNGLFAEPSPLLDGFDCAFLNPPYRKIGATSAIRRTLSSVGIETSNLYAAFVWLAARLLKENGELVVITPRSWCNGPYFKPFRRELRETLSFRRFHVFESRREAFKDGDVLQENIVFHAAKNGNSTPILISSGALSDATLVSKTVSPCEIFRPDDTEAFVYLSTENQKQQRFSHSLADLRLCVSTGRVVDFRAKDALRAQPDEQCAPLLYPLHLRNGGVEWPLENSRKHNALALTAQTQKLLCSAGVYVLVKRFSSKEQKKRVCAAVFDSQKLPEAWQNSLVGFENHLNYFHQNGDPLPLDLAMGLALFLNSSWLDEHFRSFNGHTQVNATDLRMLPYPSRATLQTLGAQFLATSRGAVLPPQAEIDALIGSLL